MATLWKVNEILIIIIVIIIEDHHRRDERTVLINQCCVKEDGRWVISLIAPVLTQVASKVASEKWDTAEITKPTIMAHAMWGGRMNYDFALKEGQVWENSNGTSSWNEFAHSHERKRERRETLTGTKDNLSVEEQALARVLMHFGDEDDDCAHNKKPISNSASSSDPFGSATASANAGINITTYVGENLPQHVKDVVDKAFGFILIINEARAGP